MIIALRHFLLIYITMATLLPVTVDAVICVEANGSIDFHIVDTESAQSQECVIDIQNHQEQCDDTVIANLITFTTISPQQTYNHFRNIAYYPLLFANLFSKQTISSATTNYTKRILPHLKLLATQRLLL